MDVGQKIKKIRELRNYTQNYMAQQLEISSAGYSKIETDTVKLTLDRLEKIAEILEVKTGYLLDFVEKTILQGNQITGSYSVVNYGQVIVHENLLRRVEELEKILAGFSTKSNL